MLPNGKLLVTTGGAIDTVYTGIGGHITYYVPKNNNGRIEVSNSDLTGDVDFNGNWTFFSTDNQFNSLTAPKVVYLDCRNGSIKRLDAGVATFIYCQDNDIASLDAPEVTTLECQNNPMTTLIAPKAISIKANGCSLSAKSIGDIIKSFQSGGRYLDFRNGTNATYGNIQSYFFNEYERDLGDYIDSIELDGGTVLLNS